MEEDPFQFLISLIFLWEWKIFHIILVMITGSLQVFQIYFIFEVGLQHVSNLIVFFIHFYGIICSVTAILRGSFLREIFKTFVNALSFEYMSGYTNEEIEQMIRYGKVYRRIVDILMLIICYALISSETLHSQGYHFSIWIFKEYFPDFATILTIVYFCICIIIAYAIMSTFLKIIYILFHIILQEKMMADTVDRICDGFEADIRHSSNLEYHKVVEARLQVCIRRIFWIRRNTSTMRKVFRYDVLVHFIGGVLVGMSLIILFNVSTKDGNQLGLLTISLPMEICIITVGLVFSGQEVINQDEKIYENLYGCPWYTWNRKNRKTLLFLLTITRKPTRVYFTENVALNNVVLLSILRAVYSFAAVLTNI